VKIQTLRAMGRYFTLALDMLEEGKKNKATLSQTFADLVDIMGKEMFVFAILHLNNQNISNFIIRTY